MYKYLFGPVASRRLGRSLGVDVVPAKTCTYDCIYCEVGRTTTRTGRRREYIPVMEILAELRRKLREPYPPDYITVTGSGEPTLHRGLGRIIRGIKKMTGIPVAVLTNGSLLWRPAVRADLAAADLVCPSLDAWDRESFQYVNRPMPGLTFAKMYGGLREFCRKYKGKIWLEILLTANRMPSPADLRRLRGLLAGRRADKIQLNTVDRPPAETWALPAPRRTMERIARFLGKKTEVISGFSLPAPKKPGAVHPGAVLRLLARRPGTAADVAAGLGIAVPEARRRLAALARRGKIRRTRHKRGAFYRPAKPAGTAVPP